MERLKQEIAQLLDQYAIILQLIKSSDTKVEIISEACNFIAVALKINSYYCLSIRCLDDPRPTLKIHGLPRIDTFPCNDLSECKELIDMYFDYIKDYYIRHSRRI